MLTWKLLILAMLTSCLIAKSCLLALVQKYDSQDLLRCLEVSQVIIIPSQHNPDKVALLIANPIFKYAQIICQGLYKNLSFYCENLNVDYIDVRCGENIELKSKNVRHRKTGQNMVAAATKNKPETIVSTSNNDVINLNGVLYKPIGPEDEISWVKSIDEKINGIYALLHQMNSTVTAAPAEETVPAKTKRTKKAQPLEEERTVSEESQSIDAVNQVSKGRMPKRKPKDLRVFTSPKKMAKETLNAISADPVTQQKIIEEIEANSVLGQRYLSFMTEGYEGRKLVTRQEKILAAIAELKE